MTEYVSPEGFTNDELLLLERYLRFYRDLESGARQPTTPAQVRFVAVCGGQAVAQTEHEKVYAKYMRLRPKLVAPDFTDWRNIYDREH